MLSTYNQNINGDQVISFRQSLLAKIHSILLNDFVLVLDLKMFLVITHSVVCVQHTYIKRALKNR